jgi:putative peptidoglycan lipid II flippase
MWPGGGGEDATQLIQRISDAGLDDAVTVPHLPVVPAAPPSRPAPPAGSTAGPATPAGPAGSATAGMRTARTSGVVRAGAVMAVATLVSRATGFLAKAFLAAVLAFGTINDAYTIANTLPNIIFELLIGGVLTSVAIPLLSRSRSDPDGGEGYTQRLVTMAAVGLIGATGLAIAAAPLLTRLYLSGQDTTSDPALATHLAYLLLPQVFFYGMAALFGAILNTKERFGTPAWAPVINNLVVIAVAILLVRLPGGIISPNGQLDRTQLLLLGLGTTAGIVMQALVMVPSLLRSGFRFRWRWGGDPRLLEAGRLMLWAIAYVVVSQIGYIVVTRVASGGVAGGVSVYAIAMLLFQMPYGILGVSILTAIMPRMSRHAAAGDMVGVKSDMSLANRLSAVALLPVGAGMVVLSAELSYLAFHYGNVSDADVTVIGHTLIALAVGLLPLAMTLVQMRVFYAMKDGRTPTLINLIMVVVRVPLLLLCARLDDDYLVPGLAAATTVSYVVGAVVGEVWLRARYGPMGTGRTLITIGKMTVASAVGGVAGFYTVVALFEPGITDFADALLQLLAGAAVGLPVIALVATALGVEELVPLRRRLARFLGFGRPAADQVTPAGHEPEPAAGPDSVESSGRGTLDATASPVGPAVAAATRSGTVPAPAPPVIVRPGSSARTMAPREQKEASVSVDNGPLPGHPGSTGPDEPTMLVPGGAAQQTAVVGTFAPGQTVGGRYRLVSLIASDSYGDRFWRAKDTVLPRDMAVTLLPGGTSTSATVARTLRAGRLHHIGLPQTLDVGSDNGQSYVVGQWVDGATLTDLLAQGPLEPNVATSITAKISEAVAEAHRNGIALGAIHPSLVRVNFDGQVRLSHVIAHGGATPDQDIRAVGGLLYLMLTASWPLADTGDDKLPPAPTRGGRELPVSEVRPAVPAALSALTTRALHPDEPDGIHAVGAIASLLRQPDAVPPAPSRSQPAGPAAKSVRTLTPAEKRLVKERRAKLTVAAVMLAAFTALIIIVVASLIKQFMNDVADPASDGLSPATTSARTTSTAPLSTGSAPSKTRTSASGSSTSVGSSSSSPASSSVALAPVKIVGGAVYDPQGDGNKDYEDLVDRAYDGDPTTQWLTFPYFQQFGPNGLKEGVGLLLELEKPITVNTVQVTTSMPGITVQIRAMPTGDVNTSLDQTQVIGSAKLGGTDPVTIPTAGATKSKYICVFISQAAQVDGKWQGSLAEVSVTGS